MKSLKQFIKESQEINESLFGDIVRKLLDTGLSWIEGSAKWVADHFVKTTAELWDTAKNLTDKEWDILRRRSGYGGYGAPRNEYEYAKIMAGLQQEKDFKKRLKNIDDTFNKLGNTHNRAALYYDQQMKASFLTLSDPTASEEDKKDAIKILDDIKRKIEKNEDGKFAKYDFVKQIDDFLKDYEKHNKEK